jgi:hypothetical protein
VRGGGGARLAHGQRPGSRWEAFKSACMALGCLRTHDFIFTLPRERRRVEGYVALLQGDRPCCLRPRNTPVEHDIGDRLEDVGRGKVVGDCALKVVV